MSAAAMSDDSRAACITRRAFVVAAAAAGVGCSPRDGNAPSYQGGWIGAADDRGHRLRDLATRASPPAVRKRASVVVVGGGIAGLAAARAIARAGIDDVQLLELEDEPGGNSRGHRIAGIACPLGAHYLPLPGPQAHEVRDLLHEFGLLRSVGGRDVADERHLCHSPQERLWIAGQWHDGLLPPVERGSPADAQMRRFSALVAEVSRRVPFALPTARAGWTAAHAELDGRTFAAWLDGHGLDDPGLRWYLDYACRDDYGAGAAFVSAWAGLHYFASRHGFRAPGDDDAREEREAVLTWPEGNAWLARRLAAPFADRLHGGRVALRVAEGRHEVAVDCWSVREDRIERWSADRLVLALPLHVASRIVVDAAVVGGTLREASGRVPHAPWLVANLHLREPLVDKPGAPPSWDNVLFEPPRDGGASLGYVDARHQSLDPRPGPTVLTAYWALGGDAPGDGVANRRRLLDEPWQAWAGRVVGDLARAHPDLPRKVSRVDLMRYGHAMAIPSPGVRGDPALASLAGLSAHGGGTRVHVAHADLAGYSVFEEAFFHGHAAGTAVAAQMLSRRGGA